MCFLIALCGVFGRKGTLGVLKVKKAVLEVNSTFLRSLYEWLSASRTKTTFLSNLLDVIDLCNFGQ